LEPALDRTREQELHQALIATAFRSFQKIPTAINALDFEFLAWLDAVLLPDCGGQDNLSLAGDDGPHDE
jgi:hypothetical protein